MKSSARRATNQRKWSIFFLTSSLLWFTLAFVNQGWAVLFYLSFVSGLALLYADKRKAAKKASPQARIQQAKSAQKPPTSSFISNPNYLNGRYETEPRPLKEGGMAVIMRATDHQTKSICIIKTPKQGTTHDDINVEKLKMEAYYLKKFGHPHIVRYIDDFEYNGKFHLVVEYIQGEDLLERYKKAPADESRVIKWASQMLDALFHIHRQGIIHRDINPGNFMVRQSGDIVMIDFGTARSISEIRQRIPVQDAFTTVGKSGFNISELVQSGDADERSDLCGVAQTCLFLLTSQEPNEFCRHAIHTMWPRYSNEIKNIVRLLKNRGVSRRTAECIAQGMSFERDLRFRNAKAMKIALLGRI